MLTIQPTKMTKSLHFLSNELIEKKIEKKESGMTFQDFCNNLPLNNFYTKAKKTRANQKRLMSE